MRDEEKKIVDDVCLRTLDKFRGMHPTYKAEAYKKLSEWSGRLAQQTADENDRKGVPDLP